MKIAFLSPGYPPEQVHFTRALAHLGATVIGVTDQPPGAMDPRARAALSHHCQVPRLFDEGAATEELVRILGDLEVDRVETNWEPLVLLAAGVRDRLGLPGMSRDACLGFRDKQTMKERVAAAGLRVPHSRRATSEVEALEAAEFVGYPLILKPIAGAGSADTFRCDDEAALKAALKQTRHVPEVSIEEFVDGDEYTYDTVCVDGQVRLDSVARYFPRPLDFRTHEWISPAQLVYRDPYDRPELTEGIALGKAVLDALGMGSGYTHMEWYRKADGEVVFGEVGCRNGGGMFVDMHNQANDTDTYLGWAQAVTGRPFDQVAHRRYHVGMVFKRAQGRGRIARIDGMEAVRARYGRWMLADELLPLGAQRRNWKATLLSDGWVTFRHAEHDAVLEMMEAVISGVRMYAR
jgi:hypothetical protein